MVTPTILLVTIAIIITIIIIITMIIIMIAVGIMIILIKIATTINQYLQIIMSTPNKQFVLI